jgi:hypothetical protein
VEGSVVAESMDEELVPVMVPRSRLTDVYRLIADGATDESGNRQAGLHRGWSAELIVEAYRAASDRMRVLLDLLTGHADEKLTSEDFMTALGADQDVVNGVLGAFGRLTNQRFAPRLPEGKNTWPFTVAKDIKEGRWTYEMPGPVAEIIKSIDH